VALRDILKPTAKRKERPPSLLFYLFIFITILAALNFALLIPSQLSSLFYQYELMILQHLNFQIILHRWELYLLLLLSLTFGSAFLPVVHVPATKKSYIYIRTWEEGELRYFRTLSGFYISVLADSAVRRVIGWSILNDVNATFEGNYLVLQTEELEVSKSLMWKRIAETLMEENAGLKDIIARKKTVLSIDEAAQMMRRGGEDS